MKSKKNEKEYNSSKLIGWILIEVICLAATIYFANFLFYKKATGTIVSYEMESRVDYAGEGYYAQIEYIVDGKKYETGHYVDKDELPTETTTIYYNPNNPNETNTDPRGPIVVVVILTFFDIVGIYLIVKEIKKANVKTKKK